MHETKHLLDARKQELLKIKSEKEKALLSVPQGTLRICHNNNRTQLYHRTDPKDVSGTYIKEKEIELAQKLAQKDYDEKVLKAVQKEIKAIDKYSSSCPERFAEEIYLNLHKERQKLIHPIKESDEEYVKKWESVRYSGKEFYIGTPELFTMKGERVRSKSEVIIADALNRAGIPYRYEYPIRLKGRGIVYPDFTVLNIQKRKEILWEHLGRMDDLEYAERAIRKITAYENTGIFSGEHLILTYETKNIPLNQKTIQLMIQKYFK